MCVHARACTCVRERARLCGGDGGGGGWEITTSSPSCLGQGCAALTLPPPPPRIVYDNNRRAAFPTLRKKENTLRVRNTKHKYVLRTVNASSMNHVVRFFFPYAHAGLLGVIIVIDYTHNTRTYIWYYTKVSEYNDTSNEWFYTRARWHTRYRTGNYRRESFLFILSRFPGNALPPTRVPVFFCFIAFKVRSNTIYVRIWGLTSHTQAHTPTHVHEVHRSNWRPCSGGEGLETL